MSINSLEKTTDLETTHELCSKTCSTTISPSIANKNGTVKGAALRAGLTAVKSGDSKPARSLAKFVSSCELPTKFGKFQMNGFTDRFGKEHVALVFGDIGHDDVLARIHSECLTGDALFSQRCDCGPQLEAAMKKISEHGSGVIFYLRQEGRGIGLLNKIRAYNLQDQGRDTVEANVELGFEADMRDYAVVKTMCDHLHIDSVNLLTNNPAKLEALESLGIKVNKRLPHEAGKSEHNCHYLKTKREKMRHLLD